MPSGPQYLSISCDAPLKCLVDVSEFFFLLGGGEGGPTRQKGGGRGRFLLKIPGKGFSQERGGGGGRGVGRLSVGIGGGG